MDIDVKATLAAVKRTQDATNPKSIVDAFGAVFFDGTYAHTFDDVMAISTPCPMPDDMVGGLQAKTLLDFLSVANSNGAATVKAQIQGTGEEVKMTAGRFKLQLPIIPLERYIFEMPRSEEGDIDRTVSFLGDLLQVLVPTMNPHEVHESEYLHGITLHATAHKKKRPGVLTLYSSDRRTLTRATAAWSGPARKILLSSRLVKDIIGSPTGLKGLLGGGSGQHAVAFYEDGTSTFAKSVVAAKPEKYEAVADSIDWSEAQFNRVDREALLAALDLIDMVVQGEEHRVCDIEATGKSLVLTGKGWSSGAVKGEASCPFKTKHKSRSSINPADLRTGLAHATHLSLHQDKAIAMSSGESFRYLAARTQPRT